MTNHVQYAYSVIGRNGGQLRDAHDCSEESKQKRFEYEKHQQDCRRRRTELITVCKTHTLA